MTDPVARFAEVVAKRTPGPWRWEYTGPGYLLGGYANHNQGIIKCILDGTTDDHRDFNVAGDKCDRDFIALMGSCADEIVAVLKAVSGKGGFQALGISLAALTAKLAAVLPAEVGK